MVGTLRGESTLGSRDPLPAAIIELEQSVDIEHTSWHDIYPWNPSGTGLSSVLDLPNIWSEALRECKGLRKQVTQLHRKLWGSLPKRTEDFGQQVVQLLRRPEYRAHLCSALHGSEDFLQAAADRIAWSHLERQLVEDLGRESDRRPAPSEESRPNPRLGRMYIPPKLHSSQRVGRNSLCPCKSGKKHKKCCGYSNSQELGQRIPSWPSQGILRPEALVVWLQAKDLKAGWTEPLVLLVALYAMLQPNEALEFGAILAKQPRFQRSLDALPPPTRTSPLRTAPIAASHLPQSDASLRKPSKEEQPLLPDICSGAPSPESPAQGTLVTLEGPQRDPRPDFPEPKAKGLDMDRYLARLEAETWEDLSENELNSSAIRLENLADRIESAVESRRATLRELEETRQAVQRRLLEFRDLPWLGPTALKTLCRIAPTCPGSIGDAIHRYHETEAQVSRVYQAHVKLTELHKGLAREHVVFLRSALDLDALASALELKVEVLGLEVATLTRREERVSELCSQIQTADPEVGLGILRKADDTQIYDLVDLVLAPTLLSSQSRNLAALADGTVLLPTLVGIAWQRGPDIGRQITAKCLGIVPTTELLGYVPLERLSELVKEPTSVPYVLEHLLAVAKARGSLAPLSYITNPDLTKLDSEVRDFLTTLLESHRRGTLSLDSLTLDSQAKDPNGQLEQASAQGRELLDIATAEPGMHKLHKKLRILARKTYLEPLLGDLRSGDSLRATKKWDTVPTTQDKTQKVLKLSPESRYLNRQHETTLTRYLQDFDQKLRAWAEVHSGNPSGQVDQDLSAAIQRLRESPSRQATAITKVLTRKALPVQVGEYGPEGLDLSAAPASDKSQPLHLATWPRYVKQGAAPLEALLLDSLWSLLGITPTSLKDAIAYYLQRADFDAAREAAAGDSDHEGMVAQALERQREQFRLTHGALLTEASDASQHDEDVASWLEEINEELREANFHGAREAIDLLEEVLVVFRRCSDPGYQALVDFLSEGGFNPSESSTTAQLEDQVAKLRANSAGQRQHLAALKDFEARDEFSERFRSKWARLRERLDRPVRWPTPKESGLLAEALHTILELLCDRLKFRHADPEGVDALVEAVEAWAPSQVITALELTDAERPLAPIFQFAKLVDHRAPESLVFKILEASAPDHPNWAAPPSELSQVASSSPKEANENQERRAEPKPPPPETVVQALRSQLSLLMAAGGDLEANSSQLRKAARTQDWPSAHRLALAALRLTVERPSGRLTSEEVLLAIAHAMIEADASQRPGAFRLACLAVLCGKNHSQYLGNKERVTSSMIVHGLLSAASLAEGEDSPEARLAILLQQLRSEDRSTSAFKWTSDVFFTASRLEVGDSPGSGILALHLWAAFTSSRKSARMRAHLLHLLYRLRRVEALRDLARRTAGSADLDRLINACVEAFLRAESDPEGLRPSALQMAAALRARSSKKSNLSPWNFFFRDLEEPGDPEDSEASPLTCEVDSTRVELDRDGNVNLELRLRPSIFDPPEWLELQLGTQNAEPLLTEGEYLFKERVVPWLVPAAVVEGTRGGLLRVPYRIRGGSVNGRDIDVRGSWELETSDYTFEPVSRAQRLRFWPGNSGNPVRPNEGFHGRERQLKEIEDLLTNDYSVMLFGQRRIGKTSFLLRLKESNPPLVGRMGAVYVTVEGLGLPKETSMDRALFNHLVLSVGRHENSNFTEALRRGRKRPDSVRLAKDIDPTRLGFATALERFVARLQEESGGKISRVAFLIDEFDRFVRPFLGNRRDEVNNLMWALREVIQHSKNVTFVLAGSGLQRLLVHDYRNALYESIKKFELGPFSWEHDSTAVEDTFVPRELRGQICAPGGFESVVERAYEFSGGHPYFLAQLGFFAAQEERLITKAVLAHIADKIAQGPNCSVFYNAIFVSLERLNPRRQAVAKAVLANVAERTTADYQWLKTEVLLAETKALDLDEREPIDAINDLTNDGAIEHDRKADRVRIRIPLTATALREDAAELRRQTRTELTRERTATT
ncbi:MAG: SEC-C domain-containing protein [Planctomycetes bacterium]|nr:SEC-C domain-containing protein [Planctomycetota bacterium]